MQGLQVFQRSAGVLELHVHLSQLVRQQSGQIRNREIAKQVHENDGLQRLQFRMRGGVRRNKPEVSSLEDGHIENEGQRGHQVCPNPGQQNASHDDDQRVKKIKGAVYAAGGIDHQGNKR